MLNNGKACSELSFDTMDQELEIIGQDLYKSSRDKVDKARNATYIANNFDNKLFTKEEAIEKIREYVEQGLLRSNRLERIVEMYKLGFVPTKLMKEVLAEVHGEEVTCGSFRTHNELMSILQEQKLEGVEKDFKIYEVNNPFAFRKLATITKSRTENHQDGTVNITNQSFLIPTDSQYIKLSHYLHDYYDKYIKTNYFSKYNFNFYIARDNVCAIHDNFGDNNYIVVYVPSTEVINTIEEILSSECMDGMQAKTLVKGVKK